MTELTGEDEQPVGSPDALRAELDELRRRVAVNDEEINFLQVEAAGTKRKWYREPSVRPCPLDHGTGSRSQILIEATSTVPAKM
jgi:hypothetical protein